MYSNLMGRRYKVILSRPDSLAGKMCLSFKSSTLPRLTGPKSFKNCTEDAQGGFVQCRERLLQLGALMGFELLHFDPFVNR